MLAHPGSLGLVPIENSSGGTVYDTVDLLIRHAGAIHLREELALDVRIALLGHPGQDIRTVYSHFVQIKHHAEWLKTRYPKAKVKPVASTALAAQKAARDVHAAALASPGAAEIYGLEVRERPAIGPEINVTHFYVIGSEPAVVLPGKPAKTALVAALPNECGSLHRFLGPFARKNVSLTRIISRPVPGQPQTYVFFLEIEGHAEDPAAAWALPRAAKSSVSLVSLGSYPVKKRYKS